MSGRLVAIAAVLALAGPCGASAKTLLVGPDQALKLPSEAAKIAASGDTIEIEPVDGGYFDCAVWRADNLVIAGAGDGVLITDKTCQGKAIFVVVGSNVTIRNLAFARARVPDGNGAGIRAEGANLTVEASRFINDESGILAAASPHSTITIRDSLFSEDGRCEGKCVPAVAADALGLLRIERTRFEKGAGGDAIRSLAARTELVSDEFSDEGSAAASGSGAVMVDLPAGGGLLLSDSRFALGPATPVAVAALAPYGAQSVAELAATGNKVSLAGAGAAIFIRDWTGTSVRLDANALDGGVTAVASGGYWWFYAKSAARYFLAHLRSGAGGTLRSVRRLL